jgi:hypothetical protein
MRGSGPRCQNGHCECRVALGEVRSCQRGNLEAHAASVKLTRKLTCPRAVAHGFNSLSCDDVSLMLHR